MGDKRFSTLTPRHASQLQKLENLMQQHLCREAVERNPDRCTQRVGLWLPVPLRQAKSPVSFVSIHSTAMNARGVDRACRTAVHGRQGTNARGHAGRNAPQPRDRCCLQELIFGARASLMAAEAPAIVRVS